MMMQRILRIWGKRKGERGGNEEDEEAFLVSSRSPPPPSITATENERTRERGEMIEDLPSTHAVSVKWGPIHWSIQSSQRKQYVGEM